MNTKVGETQARIAELTAFAADLEQAGRRLTHDADDGPCGQNCACTAPVLDGRIAVAIGTKASTATSGEPAPVACTLTFSEAADRVGDWSQLLSAQTGTPLRHVTATTASVTVAFDPDPTVAARAAELAAAEQACCAFIDFTLTIDRTGTTLTATTSLEAGPIIDALLGVPE